MVYQSFLAGMAALFLLPFFRSSLVASEEAPFSSTRPAPTARGNYPSKRGPSVILQSTKPAADPSSTVKAYGLTRRDLDNLVKTAPSIDSFFAVRVQPAALRAGRSIKTIPLMGVSPNFENLNELKLSQGRFLSDEDAKIRRNVCVMSEALAKEQFPNLDPIGRRLQVGDQYYTVAGTFLTPEPNSSSNVPQLTGETLLIPLSTMQVKLGDQLIERKSGSFEVTTYELTAIRFWLAEDSDLTATTRVIQQILQNTHPSEDYTLKTLE